MSFDIRRCSREELDELNRRGREYRARFKKVATDPGASPELPTDELPAPSRAEPAQLDLWEEETPLMLGVMYQPEQSP